MPKNYWYQWGIKNPRDPNAKAEWILNETPGTVYGSTKGSIQQGGVWDGTKWANAYTHGVTDLFWDGEKWTDTLPKPVVYPSLANSDGTILDGPDLVVKLPVGLRIDDMVISVCINENSEPRLVNPVGRMVSHMRLSTGVHVSIVVFRLDGVGDLYRGEAIRWEVSGAGPSTVANYIYRGADVTGETSNITTVKIREFNDVRQAELLSEAENTTMFLAITRTRTVANVRFPNAVIPHRPAVVGRHLDLQWRIQSGDMDSTGKAAGTLLFGTTVVAAVVATIWIPGAKKGSGLERLPGTEKPVAPPEPPDPYDDIREGGSTSSIASAISGALSGVLEEALKDAIYESIRGKFGDEVSPSDVGPSPSQPSGGSSGSSVIGAIGGFLGQQIRDAIAGISSGGGGGGGSYPAASSPGGLFGGVIGDAIRNTLSGQPAVPMPWFPGGGGGGFPFGGGGFPFGGPPGWGPPPGPWRRRRSLDEPSGDDPPAESEDSSESSGDDA